MNAETHVTEQLAAYALGILTANEAAEAETHLATCLACQQELRAYQEAAGLIAFAAPTVTPPATLKEQLLQEVSGEMNTAVPTPSPKHITQTNSWLQNLRSWLQRRPVWQPVLVLALILLLISNFQLRQQLDEANTPADFGTVTLTGTEERTAARGILIISADGEHGTLVVQDLPMLPETQTYQLWLIKDGQRTSGALFNVAEDGYRAVWVQSPEPLGSYIDFDVTIEPAEGSVYPTGATVLDN